MKRCLAFVLPLFFWGATAIAQSVTECDWQASARNLAEPWEDHTRTFANGNVRLAVLDTIEPAAAAFHVLVLSPPYDELGDRQCRVINSDGQSGFGFVDWPTLNASYDPSIGLTFHVQVQTYDPNAATLVWKWLTFTLNQATGQINVWLQ